MKITIIGAGPIGCYAGYLLAKSGHNVSIYERKKEIGLPIQCTGIFTSDFDDFGFDKSKFLVNTINQTKINFPNQEKISIKQKEYVVCRTKFDNYLANLAVGVGARIFLQHSFLRKEDQMLVIKDLANDQELRIEPEIIIAANGPLSSVAKAYGFYHPERKQNYGVQAVVKGKFDINTVNAYFGKDVCPGVFVWLVPESSTIARVGLATAKNPRYYFDKFIAGKEFEIIKMQAGIIPIYHPKQRLVQDNCYLLGDAAGFVKATTLGGIIPGMKQAEILVDSLNNKKDYEKELKPLVKRLKFHLSLRKIHDGFSAKDWDRLSSYIAQEKVQKVFDTYSRENVIKLLGMITLKEPRMLYFLKRFLKGLF